MLLTKNEIMSLDPFIEKIQIAYENDKTIQALIHSTPLTNYFHKLISERVKELRYNRTKEFFEELNDGGVDLSVGTIESEDFLYFFFQSFEYAINSRREEKVRLLARLLKSGLKAGLNENFEEFEEFSRNLDQLSYREILILYKVSDVFKSNPIPTDEQHYDNWIETYHNKIIETISKEFSIAEQEIPSILDSISKTGFLRIISVTPKRDEPGYSTKRMSNIMKKGTVEPTPYFSKLKSYLDQTT